jgi:hypothetical protein
MTLILSLFTLIIAFAHPAFAACSVLNSAGQSVPPTADALGLLLQSDDACPTDVFAFRKRLQAADLNLETTMVANRGFHNPTAGSFSLFEIVSGKLTAKENTVAINPGDFFFGHFTAVSTDNHLINDQNPEKGSLMIEAFAWDAKKELFNFYELRGDGKQGQWFYRGDSNDIVADNALLHRQPDPNEPQFGNRLRCSACHDAGGPIMKELSEPHNDWWEPKRKLDFGGRLPDETLRAMIVKLSPSDRLAKSVGQGIQKLYDSKLFDKHIRSHSLQEQLRPLFCPVELNFSSDIIPNDEKDSAIEIPAEFFIDTRLLAENTSISISRAHYEAALTAAGSHFPETVLPDADHAWLTPVKANSDKIAIENLLKNGVIDRKFVADVLDVDMTNPVLSSTRCRLLQFLPDSATPDWRDIFIKNLSKSDDPAAKQLVENLTDLHRTPEFYQNKSEKFIKQCKLKASNEKNVEKLFQLLTQRRAEIFASEISANPRGQILEPGFRIIFPENKVPPLPGKLKLSVACEVTN